MASLLISIVIHNPGQIELTGTLSSLGQALVAAGLETARVVLTDHSPRPPADGTLESWRGCLPATCDFQYSFEDSNPGFGRGHNNAFQRHGSGFSHYLVANPDLMFEPASIAAGLGCLARHPGKGLLAPGLAGPDGSLRPACFRYPGVRTLLLRALGVDARNPRIAAYECRDWDSRAPQDDPQFISGCCMLFTSDAFARLGGFDPGYFLYFEDFDLSLRASRQGLTIYCPDMRIRHFGGGAGKGSLLRRIHFVRSAFRFFNQHGWRWG